MTWGLFSGDKLIMKGFWDYANEEFFLPLVREIQNNNGLYKAWAFFFSYMINHLQAGQTDMGSQKLESFCLLLLAFLAHDFNP